MADLGFVGASLKGYGCAGMGNVEYGLMTQELERGDSGVRSFVSVQSGLVMYPIYEFGSEEQKRTWLPAMQKGEKLGCFGLTEPDFGSNPGGMRTRARKVGKEYVLNGEKMWITSGSIADVAVIWAKVENEDNKVRGFLVETDRPGFRAEDIHGKWSLRASVTSSLSMQDVHIPESNLLPESGGLKSPLKCLNQARYGIGWGALGAAMACYDCALQYSLFRKQFRDRPIASHQLVQEKLAWMITEITKAQLLALHCGRLKDQGKIEPAHISMLKRNNVTMALECARLSRDLLGANGIMDEYPIMRHMCNLHLGELSAAASPPLSRSRAISRDLGQLSTQLPQAGRVASGIRRIHPPDRHIRRSRALPLRRHRQRNESDGWQRATARAAHLC